MRKQLTILFSFLSLVFAYGAENENKSDYKIEDIVVANIQEIPEATILSVMKQKVGDRYSANNMIADYQKVKGLDYVGNVSIYPQYYNEGVRLVVDIREKKDTKSLLAKSGIIPMSERDKIDKSVVVRGVEVYGNVSRKTKEILKDIPVKVGGYYSKKKVAEGYRNLLESGYFREVVPDVQKTGNGVTVVYYVTENPTITGVNIIGNTVYSTEELLAEMETKPNETLNFNSLRKDRETIIQKYSKDGYVLARVIDIGINPNDYSLEIYVTEGVVRDIKLQKMVTKQKGNRRKATDTLLKTRDYVIEREIEFKDGDIFNINNYNNTADNLRRLGYIKNVKYEARDIPGDSDGKEIVLLIDEDRTARLQGAISYGSELGLMGMLSLEETNWKGRGQTTSFTYEKSDEDYSSMSISFSDPWIKDTDRISWGWSLYMNEYENDDSQAFHDIDTIGGRINIGKGITKNVRIGLGTKLEYVKTKPDDEYRNIPEYYEDEYYLWSLFPSITYDTRNSYFNPTRGKYARWQVEGGYASGENADYFTNTTLELRAYHRGFFKKNTFAYRTVFGIQSDGTKESQRYWVGGSSTLRGFDGGTFRGKKKVTATIENRTEFNDVLGGVLFFDVGRAWDYDGIDRGYQRDEDFAKDIAMTAGVGLRINTPMGPLRFDFGWPIGDDGDHNGHDKQSGMQFYFNMGQSF